MTSPDAAPAFEVSGYGIQWNIGQGMGRGPYPRHVSHPFQVTEGT